MPASVVKALAKEHGCSVQTVEAMWDACKKAIHPTEGGKDGYGVVVNCVKAKLSKRKAARDVAAVRKEYRKQEKE